MKTSMKSLYELRKDYITRIGIGELLLEDFVEPGSLEYDLISAKLDELRIAIRNIDIKLIRELE